MTDMVSAKYRLNCFVLCWIDRIASKRSFSSRSTSSLVVRDVTRRNLWKPREMRRGAWLPTRVDTDDAQPMGLRSGLPGLRRPCQLMRLCGVCGLAALRGSWPAEAFRVSKSSHCGEKAMVRFCGSNGADMLGRLPSPAAFSTSTGARGVAPAAASVLRSMVRVRRVSMCRLMTLSWPRSCANLRMLDTIRPRMTMPPTEKGKTRPRAVSLLAAKSPKPTVRMVTSQK